MARLRPLALAACLMAGACAHQPTPQHVAEAPPPPPPQAPPPRPELPALYAAVRVPPRDSVGYVTMNRGLSPAIAAWHLRAALNVAALACRGAEGPAIVAAYNQMLKAEATPLAAAAHASEAADKALYGSDWQAAHDAAMTRLYNYFALPPAHDGLCAAAAEIAPAAAAAPPESFTALAASALPAIEAPILAVFDRVDSTRLAIAEWDARYGPGTPPQPAAGQRLAYGDVTQITDWTPAPELAAR